MSRLKEDLGKWLESPPDTKDRQHELRKLHHEATGHWLLDDVQFIEWMTTPSALWIKGICKSILFCSNSMSHNWLQLVLERVY
jgi:hypothetical protein